MTTAWEDLDARARGLSSRLLSDQILGLLAECVTLSGLVALLIEEGYLPAAAHLDPTPGGLETALRRVAGARLRVLARWSGTRADVLAVVFEDEDRRSLRALVRGAVQRASAETRLAGLVPTPSLPERALEVLARLQTPGEVAATLAVWGNPYGGFVLGAVRGPQPDLLDVEMRLNRAFFERARGAASRGDTALVAFVTCAVDLENAVSALALRGSVGDVSAEECFVPRGVRLGLRAFRRAVAAGGPEEAAHTLARAFASTVYAEVFEHWPAEPLDLEQRLLEARLRELGREARRDPLGSAPLLKYVLGLRREQLELRRIVWGVALGAPPEVVRS